MRSFKKHKESHRKFRTFSQWSSIISSREGLKLWHDISLRMNSNLWGRACRTCVLFTTLSQCSILWDFGTNRCGGSSTTVLVRQNDRSFKGKVWVFLPCIILQVQIVYHFWKLSFFVLGMYHFCRSFCMYHFATLGYFLSAACII